MLEQKSDKRRNNKRKWKKQPERTLCAHKRVLSFRHEQISNYDKSAGITK